MIADVLDSNPPSCSIERRADGAVLVRVPSRRDWAVPLPDAVFTFRAGDPQFDYWHDQWMRKELQGS